MAMLLLLHHASLPLIRRRSDLRLVFHKLALALVDHKRFYVLMAELLNQLKVHHNVLSVNERQREELLELATRPVHLLVEQTVSLTLDLELIKNKTTREEHRWSHSLPASINLRVEISAYFNHHLRISMHKTESAE